MSDAVELVPLDATNCPGPRLTFVTLSLLIVGRRALGILCEFVGEGNDVGRLEGSALKRVFVARAGVSRIDCLVVPLLAERGVVAVRSILVDMSVCRVCARGCKR